MGLLAADGRVQPGRPGVKPERFHRFDVPVGERVDTAPAMPQVWATPPRVAQAGHAGGTTGAVDHHGGIADHERAQFRG